MCAALVGALLAPLPARAETGIAMVFGPNLLVAGQIMTFKLQNLYRSPLTFAVAVLAANGILSHYQKVTVQPLAMLDVPVTVACNPCLPLVFLANGQLGPSHYKLPLQVSLFFGGPAGSSPVSLVPWQLWRIFYAAQLTASSINFGAKFDKDDGCESWSPGLVRLPGSTGYFFATNLGSHAVQVETGCINPAGQPLAGCRQTTTIQPLNTATIQLVGALQMLPFLLGTPGTLALNFAIPQFTVAHFSIFMLLMTHAPKFALAAHNLVCTRRNDALAALEGTP